jgi:hypothetical protein
MKRLALFALLAAAAPAAPLRIAYFRADVTPPLGSPLDHGVLQPAKEIVDPLSARGVVLLGAGKPIVLAAIDWTGVANSSWDEWRAALAAAAGTDPSRVSVHTLHQHDAPAYDGDAERLLARYQRGGLQIDLAFSRAAIARVAAAVRGAVARPQTVTHVGLGRARVDRVASNRTILGPDGKFLYGRMSASRDPRAQAAPEGVIDPDVRLIGFWNGGRPLLAITFYATHPQTFYGKGGVSADFVGMARSLRESALPGVPHIHFNGAGGNVAAGKYNDGSPEMRPILARRLADGMEAAWRAAAKAPVAAADIGWRSRPVALPPADRLQPAGKLLDLIRDPASTYRVALNAARDLAWLELCQNGRRLPASRLRLGDADVLFMPGELFVDYQLAAQAMRPSDFVAMAAYGDYGPGYIGTRAAYEQGGYEVRSSRTAPDVEDVLTAALRELLKH